MTSCGCGHAKELSSALATIAALESKVAVLSSQLAAVTTELETLREPRLCAHDSVQPNTGTSSSGVHDNAAYNHAVVYDGPLLELISLGTAGPDEIRRHLNAGASTEETDEVSRRFRRSYTWTIMSSDRPSIFRERTVPAAGWSHAPDACGAKWARGPR